MVFIFEKKVSCNVRATSCNVCLCNLVGISDERLLSGTSKQFHYNATD